MKKVHNLEVVIGGNCFFAIPYLLLAGGGHAGPYHQISSIMNAYNCWNS